MQPINREFVASSLFRKVYRLIIGLKASVLVARERVTFASTYKKLERKFALN